MPMQSNGLSKTLTSLHTKQVNKTTQKITAPTLKHDATTAGKNTMSVFDMPSKNIEKMIDEKITTPEQNDRKPGNTR